MRKIATQSEAPRQTTSDKPATSGHKSPAQKRNGRSILDLQNTIGNQAVLRLLQSGQDIFRTGAKDTARAGQDRYPRAVSRTPNNSGNSKLQRTALADIPEQQRLALQIRTQRLELTAEQMDEFFEQLSSGAWGTSIPSPCGATVQLGDGVPAALQTPLTTIAGHMGGMTLTQDGQTTQMLAPNSVATVSLDLIPYGGPAGLYRYTLYDVPAGGRGGNLLIEVLSPIGGPPGGHLQQTSYTAAENGNPATISAGGQTFNLDGDLWTAERIASAKEAFSLMPAAVLTQAAGLHIRIESGELGADSQVEGGNYDPETDTVTLQRHIWSRTTGPGSAFSGGQASRFVNPVHVIAHEVAHAIDRRILEQASRTYQQSAATRADQAALLEARSPSGGRFAIDGGSYVFSDALTSTRGNDFRQAYLQDGASVAGGRIQNALTLYGAQEWQEVYAEAFSIYITDPQSLRQVRPHVYDYFEAQFPRQQSDVFIRAANDGTPEEFIQTNNLASRNIDLAALQRLNPELESVTSISTGTVVWLRSREVSAAATDFETVARRYFGSRYEWPTLWSFNPEILDPQTISPSTRIHLQSEADRAQFGEVSLTQ